MDEHELRYLALEVRVLRALFPRLMAAALQGSNKVADMLLQEDDVQDIVEEFAETDDEARFIRGYLASVYQDMQQLLAGVHDILEARVAELEAQQTPPKPSLRVVKDEPESP